MGLFKDLFSGSTIGNIIGGVGALIGAREQADVPEVPRAVREAADRSARIAAMLSDPNDPEFQRLVGEETGRIRGDFAEALRALSLENNRRMARTGGLGILNPERRDEAIAGASGRMFSEAKSLARDRTRQYLRSALSANSAVPAAYRPQQQQEVAEDAGRASAFETILAGANAIFNPGQGTRSFGSGLLSGDPRQAIIRIEGADSGPSIYATEGYF